MDDVDDARALPRSLEVGTQLYVRNNKRRLVKFDFVVVFHICAHQSHHVAVMITFLSTNIMVSDYFVHQMSTK